jgi:hypothetical protein
MDPKMPCITQQAPGYDIFSPSTRRFRSGLGVPRTQPIRKSTTTLLVQEIDEVVASLRSERELDCLHQLSSSTSVV